MIKDFSGWPRAFKEEKCCFYVRVRSEGTLWEADDHREFESSQQFFFHICKCISSEQSTLWHNNTTACTISRLQFFHDMFQKQQFGSIALHGKVLLDLQVFCTSKRRIGEDHIEPFAYITYILFKSIATVYLWKHYAMQDQVHCTK